LFGKEEEGERGGEGETKRVLCADLLGDLMVKKIKKKKKFTKDQPKDGERVALCGHPNSPTFHFWKFPCMATLMRPDGTTFKTQWLVACDECFIENLREHSGDVSKFRIREDAFWAGDAPHIEENTRH
jgi:hypothetical protein